MTYHTPVDILRGRVNCTSEEGSMINALDFKIQRLRRELHDIDYRGSRILNEDDIPDLLDRRDVIVNELIELLNKRDET